MAKPQIVQDAVTGERFKLVDLPKGQASWLFAPNLVCECTRCGTRFKPEQLSRGCPKCCGAAQPTPTPPYPAAPQCAAPQCAAPPPRPAPPHCAPAPQGPAPHAGEQVIPVPPNLTSRT